MFGGLASDYKVAAAGSSPAAIFFPSWVARGSAIGRSPLRFEDLTFALSDWSKFGEGLRGRLGHKVWIHLINWPLLCWHEDDVKAAVASFGELWEID